MKNHDDPRTFPTTIRKIITIGHSYGITLPANWVKRNFGGNFHHLVVRIRPDDVLTVETLSHKHVDSDDEVDPPGINPTERPTERQTFD